MVVCILSRFTIMNSEQEKGKNLATCIVGRKPSYEEHVPAVDVATVVEFAALDTVAGAFELLSVEPRYVLRVTTSSQ